MFGKTSLLKILFVFAILGVIAMAAVAPGVARAFFQNQGITGFTSRFLGSQGETGAGDLVDSLGQSNGQFKAVVVESQSISTMEDSGMSLVEETSSSVSSFQVGDEFEFVGTLESVDGDFWTVDGFTVVVSGLTEIKGIFEPGDRVKVEGTLQDDGSILARQIKSPDANSTSGVDDTSNTVSTPGSFTNVQIELIDILTIHSDGEWTVGAWTVVVSAGTERKGELASGVLVKVEGTLQDDSSILAYEIKAVLLEDSKTPGEVELTGILQLQEGMIWTISGVKVELTAATEVYGSPMIDDLIKVEGMMQENGLLLAREIKPALEDENGDNNNNQNGQKFEFSGELTSKNGSTWNVNGITVIVTDMTELKGTLDIGSMVKVEGYMLVDGSVEAHEIKAQWSDMSRSDDDDDDDHHGSSGSNGSDDHHDDDNDHDDDKHDDNDDYHDDDSDHDDDHSGGGGSHDGGDD